MCETRIVRKTNINKKEIRLLKNIEAITRLEEEIPITQSCLCTKMYIMRIPQATLKQML